MDFKLDIGELTNTIRDYENFIKILEEQKGNINKTVKELTDMGWSGAAKDKFEQNHSKKQEFYTNLEEDFKYMENVMERYAKPDAIKLKKRCEGFEACIKRSAGGAALTHDDIGIISLQYSGQALINKNVDECVNNHLKKMDSKFVEIQNLLNSLTFTTFPIGEDIEKARKSLKDQTTSLTDFNDSFNQYCSGVKTLESNICSVFRHMSGMSDNDLRKIREMGLISVDGKVDKNKILQLMMKNPKDLTDEEIDMLELSEIILGQDEYCKLREEAISFPDILYDKDKDSDKYSIKSQNVLVALSLKWFEANTIEEKQKIEEEIIKYRNENPKDSWLDRYTDEVANNVLGGIVGQILLNANDLSEDKLNYNIDKLNEAKGQHIYNVLGGEDSPLIAGITKRLQCVGKTPSKTSRTGKQVIARMLKDGTIKVQNGQTKFKAYDGEWYELSYGDMSHITDAVKWWNKEGRKYGERAPEVRKWMLNPDNYYLEHRSKNRADGGRIKETYLPPLDKEKPSDVWEQMEMDLPPIDEPPIEEVPPVKLPPVK
ncbi:GH-E family nuclease [Clostridium sp. JS66]|uniref:GH-E family nuclease n=1 Tax=Clostridium sp. JS66 TaxID=3064705 RepID=UPI00298E8984|nr:GH-E family nuclease [Clostridium sp. JS66]WPC43385.1 GH-E family nuclease [Clostridium sp. JS66]